MAIAHIQQSIEGVTKFFAQHPDRARVTYGCSRGQLRQIVEWAEAHSPVGDALRRAIPSSMEIEFA